MGIIEKDKNQREKKSMKKKEAKEENDKPMCTLHIGFLIQFFRLFLSNKIFWYAQRENIQILSIFPSFFFPTKLSQTQFSLHCSLPLFPPSKNLPYKMDLKG